MGLDTEKFVDAVKDINDAYENFYANKNDPNKIDGPCGEKLNIQATFQMSIPEIKE